MDPYARRKDKRKIGATGLSSEKRLAKKVGGRQTPASGALQGAKGDISLPTILMEAKSTTSMSVALKHDWLDKIAREARSQGKAPALAINFTTGDGRPIVNGEWVCVPLWLWQERLAD